MGPTLGGVARSRTLQEGPRRLLRVGGEPGETAGPTHEKNAFAGLECLRSCAPACRTAHTLALPPLGVNSKLDDIFTEVGILAKLK